MNKEPLISVIVPIYNVEAYLERCVSSIMHQTYKNLEIILVDDGSQDDCGRLCDLYEVEDSRIKVIHKENGGLSDARNAGLDIMTGEYVTCIDSDDFVSEYYIENLYTAIKTGNCQIAGSWFVDYYDNDQLPTSSKVDVNEIVVMNREEFYRKMLYQDGVEVSAWGKLYTSAYFDGVRYPKGKLYEDIPTTYKLIEKAEKIAVIPNVDYFYYQRKNSIAQSNFNIRKMDAINHMEEFKNYIIEKYPILEKAARCRYFSAVCNILFQIDGKEFPQQMNLLWSEVKLYRKSILFDIQGRKKARIAAFISFFGLYSMRFVYQIIQKD